MINSFFFSGSTHGALLPFIPQVIPESSILLPQHSLAPNVLPFLSVSWAQLPWTPPHPGHCLLQQTGLFICSKPSYFEQSSLASFSTTK